MKSTALSAFILFIICNTSIFGQNSSKINNSYDEFEGLRIVKTNPLSISSNGFEGSSYVIFEILIPDNSNSVTFKFIIRAKSKLSRQVNSSNPLISSYQKLLPYYFKKIEEVYVLTDGERQVVPKRYFTVKVDPDLNDQSINISERMKMKKEIEYKNEDLIFSYKQEAFKDLVNSSIVKLRASDIEFTVTEKNLMIGKEVYNYYLEYR